MSFQHPNLGKCRYTGFYLVNEMYGGWFATCEKGKISATYVPSEKIIELAKNSKMKIHLSGSIWRDIGKLGWGELVTPEEAEILVYNLKRKRESGELPPSQDSKYKTPEEIVRAFIEGVER